MVKIRFPYKLPLFVSACFQERAGTGEPAATYCRCQVCPENKNHILAFSSQMRHPQAQENLLQKAQFYK